MKKKLIFGVCAMALFFTTACSSDDDSNSSSSNATIQQVTNIARSGSWRITSYIDSGTIKTENFTNYNFTFGAGDILIANNGTNNYQGAWSVTRDDDSSNDIDFNISFTAPATFADLSDDWDILETTPTKIRLVDVSGGGSGTDYLTFEKNVE